MKYLNPRLSYYHLRKTNGNNICFDFDPFIGNSFASTYQISSKANQSRRSYDVISIFTARPHCSQCRALY